MGEKKLTDNTFIPGFPLWLTEAIAKAPFNKPHSSDIFRPIIISFIDSNAGAKNLEKIITQQPISRVIDVFDEQLAELFISQNAQLYKAPLGVKKQSLKRHLREYKQGRVSWQLGVWIYYPWNGVLLHMLSQDEFARLRTLRNRILITDKEQANYAAFRAGCVGMSVGSNGVAALAITGGSNKIKLADGAVLSGSNLNRVRSPVENIGLPKTIVIARELMEMNPYLEIDAVTDNLNKKNLVDFFEKPWQLDVVVDEMDDIVAKIRLRLEARKRGIPVIMVTEPGDTVMLDIERFDLDNKLPVFHGLLNNAELIAQVGSFSSERERIKCIIKTIGVANLPLRDQKAALKIGSVIPSAPQLGSTAMMAGGVIAYAVRQLATGAPLRSGRHKIDLNSLFWKPRDYLLYSLQHKKNSHDLARIIRNM